MNRGRGEMEGLFASGLTPLLVTPPIIATRGPGDEAKLRKYTRNHANTRHTLLFRRFGPLNDYDDIMKVCRVTRKEISRFPALLYKVLLNLFNMFYRSSHARK